MPNPQTELLQRVEEAMTADAFVAEFERFAAKNCSAFEDTEENLLEYTPIYNKFLSLFAERFEAVVAKTGASQEEFEAACQDANQDSFIVLLLLSITSFDQFKTLMIEQKRAQQK